MTTIAELGAFLAREKAAASPGTAPRLPGTPRTPVRVATTKAEPELDGVNQ